MKIYILLSYLLITDIFACEYTRLFMKRFIIILFSAVLPFVSMQAQTALKQSAKVWTLHDCIDYALANNIQVKQQQLSEQVAKINLLQSNLSLFPGIEADASHGYNYGRTIDMFTNQFATSTVQSDNFYLSSSITVFDGFQLLNTIKQNRINLQASQYDLDKMMNDISLNIATAYLQILYNIELLNNAQNQLDVTKQQVDRTKKLVDAGTAAKGDLLTLEAQAASEDLNVVTAQNTLDLSYLLLSQMLNLTSPDSFKIAIPQIDVPSETAILLKPEQVFAFAMNTQPEIKSAELKVQSSEVGLSIARGMRSPIISLRGSLGTGFSGDSKQIKGTPSYSGLDTIGYTYSTTPVAVVQPQFAYQTETIPFKDQIKDNFNKSISLNLSMPIFSGWRTNGNISKAKIAVQNAEYTLQTTKNTLFQSIQQAYADATAARNKYQSSQKSVDAMKESFKYSEQRYNVGLVNSVDYDDAKNKLVVAESNLLQAKYEFVFRLKILDFYMGKPIELK
jgi:outer membrane protein